MCWDTLGYYPRRIGTQEQDFYFVFICIELDMRARRRKPTQHRAKRFCSFSWYSITITVTFVQNKALCIYL